MKVILNDVIALDKELQIIGEKHSTIKLDWCIAKNINITKKFLKSIMDIKESKEFKEFIKTREELAIKYALKGEDGNPVLAKVDNGYNITLNPETKDEYIEKNNALVETNKEIIEVQKLRDIDYKNSLEELVDIELYTISEKEIDKAKELNPSILTISQLAMFDEVGIIIP